MSKSVSYVVDICASTTGTLLESQCECAAGMGPNSLCKHVCVVLYGCFKFHSNGNVKTEQTCTQKLQTFHQTKRFTGCPIKARGLDLPGCDEVCNIDFDPRPELYRNNLGYNSFFRNVCLNFRGGSQMPVFQMFPPAN